MEKEPALYTGAAEYVLPCDVGMSWLALLVGISKLSCVRAGSVLARLLLTLAARVCGSSGSGSARPALGLRRGGRAVRIAG